ncbi:MAG: nitrile hydratase accessory protein [Ilumatobacter sp.]|jgi:nitrile hydratase accessory protein|uniref:nitrile hydratase accessory protein n=1 Tax=Ilumatobacter sp. TaxID=1967498 RepID=UPI00391BDCC7
MTDNSSSNDTMIDDLVLDGPAAAPRSNGELVFESPWEGRAFGLALAMVEKGFFTLDDFQAELIVAIAEWEALGQSNEEYRYYECWLVALERLVERSTAVGVADVDARSAEFLTRPAGHDHSHDDGHHHH